MPSGELVIQMWLICVAVALPSLTGCWAGDERALSGDRMAA